MNINEHVLWAACSVNIKAAIIYSFIYCHNFDISTPYTIPVVQLPVYSWSRGRATSALLWSPVCQIKVHHSLSFQLCFGLHQPLRIKEVRFFSCWTCLCVITSYPLTLSVGALSEFIRSLNELSLSAAGNEGDDGWVWQLENQNKELKEHLGLSRAEEASALHLVI